MGGSGAEPAGTDLRAWTVSTVGDYLLTRPHGPRQPVFLAGRGE